MDQDIKLFEFQDIQKYSTYNEGPKAKEFCQFHSSSTSTELDGFDASIFWSAGLCNLFRKPRPGGILNIFSFDPPAVQWLEVYF